MDPRLELADMLLRKAKDDLAMARRLAGDPATPDWGVGFHSAASGGKGDQKRALSKGDRIPSNS
jgi:hypothetical protein